MDSKDLELAAQMLLTSTFDTNLENPNSEDRLFVHSKDYWHLNACITKFDGDHSYISGYLKAAKLLARIVIFSASYMDTLVYPIIYLYRHYLELQLKHLIYEGAIMTDLEIDIKLEKILHEHNLMSLWGSFVPLFEEICQHESDLEEVKKGMESYIQQIHEIDPQSFSFRYKKSKTGKNNLEEKSYINIGLFCQNMEKLTDLLEGIDSEFSAVKDFKYNY